MLLSPCLKLGLEVVVDSGLYCSDEQDDAEENCPEVEDDAEENCPDEEQVEAESQLLGVW